MKSLLITIRGNSSSGKTTLAKGIQTSFRRGHVMCVSQDDIRLGVLNVKDRKNGLTPDLVKSMVNFGRGRIPIIVLEGIFGKEIYENMFDELQQEFNNHTLNYYYNVPFEETVIRHETSPKVNQFDTTRMASWYLQEDYMSCLSETVLTQDLSIDCALNKVLNDIKSLDI